MEILKILNAVDIMSLLIYVMWFVIFVWFWISLKKQNVGLKKVDESIKLQAAANRQLDSVVNELRRANRLLAELADMGSSDTGFVEANDGYRASKASSGSGHVSSHTAQNTSSHSVPCVDSLYKLYVGNIDYKATEAELGDYFSPYGQVECVNIPVNRYTGRPRGFGFVTFVSEEDAKQAMALHGTEFKGRQIQVNFAKERETG